MTGVFHHMLVEEQETVEKLKKQAAEDWELLLLQRAKEMAPGGLSGYTWAVPYLSKVKVKCYPLLNQKHMPLLKINEI